MSVSSPHTSAAYSITVHLKIENKPGRFASILSEVAQLGGSLAEMSLIESTFHYNERLVTIAARSEAHAKEIESKIRGLEAVELISCIDDTFHMHIGGKLSVDSKSIIQNFDELSRAYSPGVARVCTHIEKNPEAVFEYTIKKNTVAVISDGSAVLGLGNIGPKAAIPVMEGKAVLFKQFAGIDAFPICLETQDTEEIIRTVKNISTVFGGINLEDISAPRCFEIERRLQAELNIPVFHDDQHGTAVVVLAGMLNALKILNKKIGDVKIVVNGFGAGGVACTKMLHEAGARNIIPCDSKGIVYRGRPIGMNSEKDEVLKYTNPENEKGTLSDALRGADIFLGVSVPGAISRSDVQAMAKDPIVFALANPIPEIIPGEIQDIARIIATGRSDYANQVNNVLCFPGIFRGALDARATSITPAMKRAAAYAIAESIPDKELREDNIIPSVFNPNVPVLVAERVKKAALDGM
jgi:malate dehydrogenase (oxaloacetate-decarboxylating)